MHPVGFQNVGRSILGSCPRHLELKIIKIGARLMCHDRVIILQLAEMTITGATRRAVLTTTRRLRPPPFCAGPRSTPRLHESDRKALPAGPKNTTEAPEHGGFAAWVDLFQSSAGPKKPLERRKCLSSGRILVMRASDRMPLREMSVLRKYFFCHCWGWEDLLP